GTVEILRSDTGTKVKVTSRESFDSAVTLPKGAELLVATGDLVHAGQPLARVEGAPDVVADVDGFIAKTDNGWVIRAEDIVPREYAIPHNARLLVDDAQLVRAGDAITDGPINPQEYLETRGRDAVQRYLVKEVQKVYRSQ